MRTHEARIRTTSVAAGTPMARVNEDAAKKKHTYISAEKDTEIAETVGIIRRGLSSQRTMAKVTPSSSNVVIAVMAT
jgi:hypothetical protein